MSFGSTSLPPPTADELARWASASDKGCVVCAILTPGQGGVPTEQHHLLSAGGLRLGHRFTVCLCRHHHQQVKTRAFKKHFPDAVLLRRQDELIDWPTVELPVARKRKGSTDTPSKVFPRPPGGFSA